MDQKHVLIELDANEAAMFVKFQKHFAFIGLLESVGAFDIQSGSVTINFDGNGAIVSVDKREHFNSRTLKTAS